MLRRSRSLVMTIPKSNDSVLFHNMCAWCGPPGDVREMLRHEPAVCELLRTMRSTPEVGPEKAMARLNRGRCLLPQVRGKKGEGDEYTPG